MDDIIAWSFETHGIQRQVVVVYSNVYTYMLVIHTVERKQNFNISNYRE